MKGENLLSGMPEHLRRRGKKLGDDANVERVIKVFNPTNKTVSVSQGEGGYSCHLKPNEQIFLSEEGWGEMQKLFSIKDLLGAGFKFQQEFREKK